ncbi:unnamed protein product [Heligmosomoides polygyrus]|uniref:Uncharacterized protein n=1 Tax=Heligmosomoides polygyrus TaxID=6339 RepID=A0A183GHL6_HELPZ|nr:unnamed protein product [Heligmosomoides polygyrus]
MRYADKQQSEGRTARSTSQPRLDGSSQAAGLGRESPAECESDRGQTRASGRLREVPSAVVVVAVVVLVPGDDWPN